MSVQREVFRDGRRDAVLRGPLRRIRQAYCRRSLFFGAIFRSTAWISKYLHQCFVPARRSSADGKRGRCEAVSTLRRTHIWTPVVASAAREPQLVLAILHF